MEMKSLSGKAYLDDLSEKTGAGKYEGPGLLVFCPDDLTTRDLAIMGGAASVTRPDKDDGPDHGDLVQSGILRLLGLGARVAATLGQVPRTSRLPEGAVCVFHPDCPTEGPLREEAEAWISRASADPVRVPNIYIFASKSDHDLAVKAGILSSDIPVVGHSIPPEDTSQAQVAAFIVDVMRLDRFQDTMRPEGDLAIIDNPVLSALLPAFTDGVPSPVIRIYGDLREETENEMRNSDLEMTHVIHRNPAPTPEESPAP